MTPAFRFLQAYDPRDRVRLSDVYDDDADLRAAIFDAMPDFEYPDWSHRTVHALAVSAHKDWTA